MSSRQRRLRERERMASFEPAKKSVSPSKISLLVLVIVVGGAFFTWTQVSDRHGESLPKCPVGAAPVNFAISQATDQGPLYFCCSHCIQKYASHPETYSVQSAQQREALADRPRIQIRCQGCGAKLATKVLPARSGETPVFCTSACRGRHRSNPPELSSVAARYTYQIKCPVSGNLIDPGHSATMRGGFEVFFCSSACQSRFLDAPTTYAKNLAAQGIRWQP